MEIQSSPVNTNAFVLLLALWIWVIVQCLSLAFISPVYSYLGIQFNLDDVQFVLGTLAIFLAASVIFAIVRFSFGYFCGLLIFGMVANYIWLSHEQVYDYDYATARTLVVQSLVAFLIPVLSIRGFGPNSFALTERRFLALNWGLIAAVALILPLAGFYNFQIVELRDIYEFRDEIELPGYLNYLWNISLNSILPFTFATFLVRRNWIGVALSLVLALAFYPVTLTKGAFFLPIWLMVIAIATRWLETRLAIVFLLTLVAVAGMILAFFEFAIGDSVRGYFNFRFLAVPANSLEHYLDFFSKFETTRFCHISFFKNFINCPYDRPLSVIMNDYYKVGNINASFLATEGVAALGMSYMPVASFLAGVAVGFGNICSHRLSPRFVVLSAAMIIPNILNIPLATLFLTGGYAALLVLWMLTPRSARPTSPEPSALRTGTEPITAT